MADYEKKYRVTPKWFLWFVMMFIFSELAWADPKTEEIIRDIQSKNSTITAYRFDMVVRIKGLMGNTVTSVGKMSYKKPDMFRLETKMDNPLGIGINHEGPLTTIIISDGEVLYQYIPEKKQVQKARLKGKENLFSFIDIHLNSQFFEELVKTGFQYTGEDELDSKKMYILQKEEPTIHQGMEIPYDYNKAKLWIGKEDGFLYKMETLSKSGDTEMRMSEELKNIELNPIFAEDTFHFTPPEGVRVIDDKDLK